MDEGPFDLISQIKDLVDMVESRWWPDTDLLPSRPVARLRKVHVDLEESSFSSYELEKIKRYREEGLNLRIGGFN